MKKSNLEVTYLAEFQDGTRFHICNESNKPDFEERFYSEIESGKQCKKKEEIKYLYESPDQDISVHQITDLIKGSIFYYIECIELEKEYEVHNTLQIIEILTGKISATDITNLIVLIELLEINSRNQIQF